MIDLSKKSCLIWDLSGSYTFIAESMVGAFGKVFYHNEWETGFPEVQDFLPGIGLEGVERAVDPFDILDQTDLVVFPDVGLDGLQQWLREQGILVWGSAKAGALERDRFLLKTELEGRNMDVVPYQVIQGLPALREFLEGPKNAPCIIKVAYFRGLTETWKHKSYFESEGWLDEKATKLGPYQHIISFLVEKKIEGKTSEPGVDSYAVNGVIPEAVQWGYENKDAGYVGCCGARLPDRLRKATEQFLPILAGYDYRGPFSTEVMSTEEGEDYTIDFTARLPLPPSETYCANIFNLPEIFYQGARGILVEAGYLRRFAVQFVVKSDALASHAIGVKVGEPENIFLHGHARIEGKDYCVSPNEVEEFAGAVGCADSLEDACQMAFEAAESIEGDRVSFSRDALKEALECIEQGEALGLTFGDFS